MLKLDKKKNQKERKKNIDQTKSFQSFPFVCCDAWRLLKKNVIYCRMYEVPTQLIDVYKHKVTDSISEVYDCLLASKFII